MSNHLRPLERESKNAIEGEVQLPADREHRLQRVRGALNLLYVAGQKVGSRRLQAAALDGLNAARGLNDV